MIDIIKPVRYGILVGLLGLTFGIGWVFYLVLGHESIHRSFEQRALEGKKPHSLLQLLEPGNAYAHGPEKKTPRQQGEHADMMKGEGMTPTPEEDKPNNTIESAHDDPIMELAHNRLLRGHIHAMGLGLVTIAISFIMAFTRAPDRIKTIAPVLAGIGGIIYPFAWIVMGYRTPGLGPDAAAASVRMIAGIGTALVLLGIFTAGVFLLKDILQKR
ncbi:MAG TPA: hypothetical protein VJ202_06955 [Thermodesulfobacteriota bacterium]|nr:hypothetical protein [Thermodesulfobacteriota bacterium]